MLPIVIFMGPPGSGKGTQAKQLCERFNVQHISTGDLLRALAANPSADPSDKQMLEAMKRGELVADTLIYKLAFDAITRAFNAGRGVVLDGAIRTVHQAKEYLRFFAAEARAHAVQVIVLDLSDEESFNRLANRRVCPSCGTIVPWTQETQTVHTCPSCGTTLVKRTDDNQDTIRERIKEQGNAAMAPVVAFFESTFGHAGVTHIDATPSIIDVWKQVEQIYTKTFTQGI